MSALRKTVSPFPGVVRNADGIDVSLLKVEHSTPIPARAVVKGKYDELFDKRKFGSCVVCETDEFSKVSNALRKWLQVRGRKGKIKGVSRCEDGHARVWLVGQ